ncbi:MAG: hypothetical protein M3430_12525 [Acidobacteriota bacterium]|nr:hypothetical protein [Acidobacteriota bacterium]
MRDDYDFSKGVRGKHADMEIRIVGAKASGARSMKAEASKAKTARVPKDRENFDEAVRLLMRARPHLQDSQRAQKIKEQIQEFLDRTVA